MQVLSTDRVEFRVVKGKDSEVDADSEQQVENGEGSVQEDPRSSRGDDSSSSLSLTTSFSSLKQARLFSIFGNGSSCS